MNAQTGTLQGFVKDPSGSSVPGAAVLLSHPPATDIITETDAQGHYVFTGVAAGTYILHATAAGFAPYASAPLALGSEAKRTLDIPLVIRAETEGVTVTDTVKVETDPSSNAGALVLRNEDLDALPDDRDDLAADLQALAGPAAGPNGGQVYIDGFTGGRLPSKQSIREIRINSNPFSAQYDRPGQGRIEIFTKPGADDFHGELQFHFGDAIWNSRNPFSSVKPPYQRRQWEGEFTGPLNKKTSFFFDFERRDINENAFVTATVLDSGLNPVPFSQAIVTPLIGIEINAKIDRQLTKNHTLTLRYGYAHDQLDNQGVGAFSLPSRAYNALTGEHVYQAVETGILNPHTINETKFRLRRQTTDQSGGQIAPTITVLDAFSNGGSPLGVSFDHQDRYELQNSTSYSKGSHLVRFGGLVREVGLSNQSMQNYAGTFTFTSLASYRATLLGMQQGLPLDQIRNMGGGPSQFSISAGNPLAALHQGDFGFFLQDDWRIQPNLTVSGGLRYEFQTHAGDHRDFGPRLGIAWGLGGRGGKPVKTVVRGGFGIFYDRLPENLTLDALRQDGIRQQQFLIASPTFYPSVPSIQSLVGSAQPQTIRETAGNWVAPMMTQGAIGIERQLAKGVTLATNYIHSIGDHALRSRNINAPLPSSGIRPYGGVNAIYLYETSGVFRQDQWITNLNARLGSKMSFSGFYAWGSAKSNTDGATTFPANQYDLTTEYGRAGFDVRHRVQLNGSFAAKWGFRISPFMTLASGRPYNITTGTDLNNDGLYLDRPAFATDLSRASVVHTPYGALDTNPLPGQRIIPRNFAQGPGVVSINMRLAKAFTIGEHDGKSKSDPKQVTISLQARNLINHPNFALPIGNLSSPVFGQSTSLAAGQGVIGTRRLEIQAKFSF